MRTTPGHFTFILVVAVVFGGAGWLLGRAGGTATAPGGPAEVASLRNENRALQERVDTLDARVRELSVANAAPPRSAPRGVVPAAAPESLVPEVDPTVEAEMRLRRIGEIRDSVAGWFANAKGAEALAALKELAALVPEGREAAMDMAMRINADVTGDGALGLSQMVFYTSLGDPAVRDLMLWSLENPSPGDFRVMTAYSLPWTMPPEEVVGRFTKALAGEKEAAVQRALVGNLAQLRNPEADATLLAILKDPAREASLRSLAATELTASNDPEVLRSIEDMSVNEPDAQVRAAATTAMRILNPPATGFLVTGTLPQSQAAIAGVEAGDILVSYDGRRVENLDALRPAAGDAKDREDVEIVVLRGDREVTLRLRPGQMGVYGRDVTKK